MPRSPLSPTSPRSPSGPRPLRSVLVPLAISSSVDQVIDRVARLPLAADARLLLLHVVPALRGLGALRGEDDARVHLAAAATALAHRLARTADVSATIAAGLTTSRIAEAARAIRAELIVMGPHAHPLRELAIGTTAARVVRKAKRPVLVARLPAARSYRRPLLALDLEEPALQLLAFTARVLAAPRPTVALVHAYEAPFQALAYSSLSAQAARAYREHCRQQASRRLEELLAAAHAQLAPDDSVRWTRCLRYGAPREVIARAAAGLGCDLLALGTHARSGVARALLGSVAGDVLRSVACDVLLVPRAPRPGARR